MMDKLFMAACMAILVAGISTLAHANPAHPSQAQIAEWHEIQATTARELKAQHASEQRNLNPTL